MTLPDTNLYVLFLQFVSDDRLLLKMAVKTTIKKDLNTLLNLQKKKKRDKKMFIFSVVIIINSNKKPHQNEL